MNSQVANAARAHLAWVHQAGEVTSAVSTSALLGHAQPATVLWSSPQRLRHRDLHAWLNAEQAADADTGTDVDSPPRLLGGVMSVRAKVHNQGDASVDLGKLTLSAAQWNGLAGEQNAVVWHLAQSAPVDENADGAAETDDSFSVAGACSTDEPGEDTAGDDASGSGDVTWLPPGATVTRTFCTAQLSPAAVLSLLNSSAGVSMAPSIAADEGAAPPIEVHVDYAGLLDSEQHRYPTLSPTTAGEVLEALSIAYSEGHNWWASAEASHPEMTGFGITQVRGVAADAQGNAYFLATLSRGTGDAIVFNPHVESYHFASIRLEPGDVLHVAFVQDQDADGLISAWESALGTSDVTLDSDGDGLDDGREVLGWSLDDGSGTSDSDPTLADTDQDGIDDSEEHKQSTDPRY